MGYLTTGQVHIGSVLDLAGQLEPQSVQTIVTSPPYWGLRSYLPADHSDKAAELGSEPTPEEFVANLVRVFAALRPALKDDGTLWLNLGDSYASDTKWGGKTSGKHADGLLGTDYIGRNRHRTGLPHKSLVMIPHRVALALQADGWVVRGDIVWAKPNPMPESVTDRPTRAHEYIFLIAKSPRYFYDADAIKECYADGTAGRIGQPSLDAQQGGYKTEMYQQDHPGKKARDRRPADILRAMRDNGQPGRNKRDVWTVTPAQFPGAHFATFAPDLIRPCVLSGTSEAGECSACGKAWARCVEKHLVSTPKASKRNVYDERDEQGLQVGDMASRRHRDGHIKGLARADVTTGWRPQCQCPPGTPTRPQTVLDPFAGSGTTPYVAAQEGRSWIGFDLDARAVGWTAERLQRLPVGRLAGM